MSTIILLLTLFALTFVALSAVKGADFLADPDPEETEREKRRAVLLEYRQISDSRPDHIVSTADSEFDKYAP
jgi:hypothetical protein|tara:strand:+ start:136 stop:351 length:216 start_codon:yes stop_codon:yes gene_type:complete